MNSPEQPQGKESKSKPAPDKAQATQSPKAFRPVLGELQARRQQKEAHDLAKARKRARHRAQTEFKAWKRSLCELINKGSTIEWIEQPDGSLAWKFVVPARLNQFFYEVMINEYVAAKKASSKGGAARLVRQEFDAAADAVLEAEQKLQQQHQPVETVEDEGEVKP
jgi:hypothetical protein